MVTKTRRPRRKTRPHGLMTCSICFGPRDRPNQAYCRSCHNQFERERRAALRPPKKPRTRPLTVREAAHEALWLARVKVRNPYGAKLCSGCGGTRTTPSKRYCTACSARYRKTAPRKQRSDMTYEQLKKDRARKAANMRLHRGQILRGPCVDCCAPKAEMHHEDYDKPFDVTWLCRRCHRARHHAAEATASRRKP